MTLTPEQKARVLIDAALEQAGWLVQDRAEMNLTARRGVAVREFKMASGRGFADYLLFVDGKAIGALEAKPVGYPLINVELQVDQYAHGLPAGLNPPVDPCSRLTHWSRVSAVIHYETGLGAGADVLKREPRKASSSKINSKRSRSSSGR